MKHYILIQGKKTEWSWSRGGEIIHEIGHYSIVECTIKEDSEPSFHPFVKGNTTGTYARSLDEALILAMVYWRGNGYKDFAPAIMRFLS